MFNISFKAKQVLTALNVCHTAKQCVLFLARQHKGSHCELISFILGDIHVIWEVTELQIRYSELMSVRQKKKRDSARERERERERERARERERTREREIKRDKESHS